MRSKKGKFCSGCGKKIKKEEYGLSCKLVGDDAQDMFCLTCLAEYIGCLEEDLAIKVQEFKEQGCELFL